jgi:hypothetical protein
MRNDVVDNQTERLAERLDALLDGANRAHLAVGYFFLEGLAPLQKRVEQLESLEILIGNVINRLTEEQVREEAKANIRGGESCVRGQEEVAATLRETRDRAAARVCRCGTWR